ASGKEFTSVLERVAIHPLGKNSTSGERLAVARFYDANLIFRDRREFLDIDFVLPRPVSEMDARRERIGLYARPAADGHDASIRKRTVRTKQHEFLVDHTHTVLRNDNNAKQSEDPPVCNEGEWDEDQPPIVCQRVHHDVADTLFHLLAPFVPDRGAGLYVV